MLYFANHIPFVSAISITAIVSRWLFPVLIHYFIYRMVANTIDKLFSKGDPIAIDMPMTTTAVIIYLGIILAGCIVVSVADSFAAKEIAVRLSISKAKGIFTQVGLLDKFNNSDLLRHVFPPFQHS